MLKELLRKIIREETGSVVVLVALSMTVLLGMSALVVDVGLAYAERTKLQNAVDAAVLAGAQELPQDPEAAREMAFVYGEKNGVTRNKMIVEIPPGNGFLRVSATRQLGSFFARILTTDVHYTGAEAVAQVGSISALRGAAPLAVRKEDFSFGDRRILKVGGGAGDRGWFGALALGGRGASRYRGNLEHGYDGILAIGDLVETEPGNMSGPTKKGINARIARACSSSTFEDPNPDCPRLLIIPVYDWEEEKGGRRDIRIAGFAVFFVEEVTGSGKNNEIWGRFVEMVVPGEIRTNAPNYGARGVKLTH